MGKQTVGETERRKSPTPIPSPIGRGTGIGGRIGIVIEGSCNNREALPLSLGGKTRQELRAMRVGIVERERAVQGILLNIECIVEREPRGGRIEHRYRTVGLTLPVLRIANTTAWCAVLVAGMRPVVFRIYQQCPTLGKSRTETQLSEGILVAQSLMVLVSIIMYDAWQPAVAAVVIHLSCQLIPGINLPVGIQLPMPSVHSAVGAMLTRSQRDVLQGEGIVVVSMEEFTDGRE